MLFLNKKDQDNKKTLYKNARIIDPKSNFDKYGQLLTIGDKVVDYGYEIFPQDVGDDIEVVDCKGHVLCPALIDIQVHFRDPGQTHKEDIVTGSKSAVAGGVGCVVCQPNTSPTIDNAQIIEQIYDKAKKEAYCNIFTYGSITQGLKGLELTDFAALKQAGAVGLTDDGLPVMNANLMRKSFEEAQKYQLLVAQHAEDLNLTDGGCINEGDISKQLKLKGIPNISESVIVKRDLEILEQTGGQYHLLHVSTRQALDAIRQAKAKGLNVTTEVTPHHFYLNDSDILKNGTNAKMNPPLRSEEDRLEMIKGLQDDSIDAIATDHAPHDIDSKNKPISQAAFGIVGLETLLPISLSLYHDKLLSLRDVLAKLTYKPAEIINIDRGYIAKNAIADLVLIDLDHQWTIDANKLHSKSKNTPFDGLKFKGKAIRTIIAGQTTYINEL